MTLYPRMQPHATQALLHPLPHALERNTRAAASHVITRHERAIPHAPRAKCRIRLPPHHTPRPTASTPSLPKPLVFKRSHRQPAPHTVITHGSTTPITRIRPPVPHPARPQTGLPAHMQTRTGTSRSRTSTKKTPCPCLYPHAARAVLHSPVHVQTARVHSQPEKWSLRRNADVRALLCRSKRRQMRPLP